MNRFIVAIVLVLSLFFTDTSYHDEHRVRSIYLITIDGTRWQDIIALDARQRLPNIYGLLDNGIGVGRDSLFTASGNYHVSLPGYLEITRGHQSTDCPDNYCKPNPLGETVIDSFQNAAIFAGWDEIDLTITHKSNTVINIGRNIRSPAWLNLKLSDNQTFPEWFSETYRSDPMTSSAMLEWQRLPKLGSNQFVWISLGDTDEWAHYDSRPKYLDALHDADTFVGKLLRSVDDEDATFIITADHGRNDNDWSAHGDPSSGRLWLVLSGAGVPARGWVTYAGELRSLSNVLPTIKHLLAPDGPRPTGTLL